MCSSLVLPLVVALLLAAGQAGQAAGEASSAATPSCRCPPAGPTVCGSDGVTYQSQCLLLCARWDGNKPELSVAHHGPCAGAAAAAADDAGGPQPREAAADDLLHCFITRLSSFRHCQVGCSTSSPTAACYDTCIRTFRDDVCSSCRKWIEPAAQTPAGKQQQMAMIPQTPARQQQMEMMLQTPARQQQMAMMPQTPAAGQQQQMAMMPLVLARDRDSSPTSKAAGPAWPPLSLWAEGAWQCMGGIVDKTRPCSKTCIDHACVVACVGPLFERWCQCGDAAFDSVVGCYLQRERTFNKCACDRDDEDCTEKCVRDYRDGVCACEKYLGDKSRADGGDADQLDVNQQRAASLLTQAMRGSIRHAEATGSTSSSVRGDGSKLAWARNASQCMRSEMVSVNACSARCSDEPACMTGCVRPQFKPWCRCGDPADPDDGKPSAAASLEQGRFAAAAATVMSAVLLLTSPLY